MEACRSNTSDVLLNGDVLVRVVEAGVTIATATTRNLKMLVELKVRPSASSKEFLVRLTDDHDPFVLYTCVVHEDDYHTLRHTQGLLVDFNSFPHKFVELVNACHKENGKESPRFILVLRCSNDSEGGATLEVVEVNVFKHLCHLALALVPAPTQLKLSYLAECCKALKGQVAAREREAAENEQQLQQQLRYTQEILAKTSKEAQQLRTEISQHVAMSSEKEAQLIAQEKEKLLKVQSDADRKADRVRRDLEARKNNQIEQLQSKIVSLTSQNNELLEKKQRAESNVKELRGRLSCAEGDLDRCRQELAHTKKHSTRLEQENCTKNAAVRELEVKVSHLEGELRSREISLAHVQQMVETLQHQKGNLEEGLEERRQKLLKRENSIQLLYAELQKSLDVIKKLQKRVKEEHMTSKVRGAALVEQDKVVAEKDSSVLQLSEQLQLMTTKVSQLTMDNGNLQQQLQDAREKLQEQEKTLQTNENVISWLNKQLNEVEVTGAIAKRAPLTEIYLTSQGPSSHGTRQPGSRFPSGSPGLVAHSTPLSNTLRSLTTVNSGWSGQTHTTVSSVRTLGNIPPIPEEISPRTTDKSPAEKDISPIDKENLEGLDPKYFEVTNPASVPVQGLLRANYCNTSPPDSHPKELRKDKTLEKRGGMIEGRGRGNRGRSSGRGGKGLESQKKTGVSNSHASSYFPRN
nr:spindle assembly abnormal protein 6 homolog isoform X1 [Cherax quadricarinatus]XP_053634138.1 spindle assembly abnormal protein 6 homolog isoform X1 [Cherax quadricarinatus]XP_053634139.1 spindle assembly abnormal protein 6 homolog isoform X1 [Cherax quadricarinatus]XP_053634140.1 spindle assembly abnormal protein 6 homolog isoform X1 [Cherax quadricarinatus]